MNPFLKRVKRSILRPYYINKLIRDVKRFESTKIPNHESEFQNMISAFCATAGKSNSKISEYLSNIYPAIDFSCLKEKSLFRLEEIDFAQIDHALKLHGYFILPERLSSTLTDELYQFAISQPAIIRPKDGQHEVSPALEQINLKDVKSIIYDIPRQSLINNPVVQALASDYVLLNIAQNYLGTEPIWDMSSMWWSTNYSKMSDKNAAQWFHFDMDRIKWIKVFVYLTDVFEDNGPHTFIEGSNQDGSIPRSLLAKGYKRLSDLEVERAFGKNKFVEFKAPKGTLIFEDTRGIHKGKNVTGDPRCVLQLQFSNSLFGVNTPKCLLNESSNAFINKMKGFTSRFLELYGK